MEMIMTYLILHSVNHLEGLREITKSGTKMACNWAKIQTTQSPNASVKRNLYAGLLGSRESLKDAIKTATDFLCVATCVSLFCAGLTGTIVPGA